MMIFFFKGREDLNVNGGCGVGGGSKEDTPALCSLETL